MWPKTKKGRILTIALLVILAMQFYRPVVESPPVEPGNSLIDRPEVPVEVAAILKRSCYDCHSYETSWPWYSRLAPVSWLIAHDVNEAREHLDLSDWGAYSAEAGLHKIEEICEEVEEGEMPLFFYLWLHPEARLDPQEVRLLCEWAHSLQADGGNGRRWGELARASFADPTEGLVNP